jgi:hypothetical protein
MFMRRSILFLILLTTVGSVFAQVEPFWKQDSTFIKELYVLNNKYNSLSFSGYLQMQYQIAALPGILSYNGGNFASESDNRFMIRRGRFRIDYERKNEKGFYRYNFALQFDGTEKGVNVRDMFGRLYENKWNYFVATFGIFNRPFSYELNYSSSLRESPERGRMSQILMKTERDIGAMISFEPQDKRKKIYPLKVDAGIFNGQGLAGPEDYDSFKDFIARASIRRTKIAKNLYASGGISYLNGGFRNGSAIFYNLKRNLDGEYLFTADSSVNNTGKKSPRIYYGADFQLLFENVLGKTELRAEYIKGTQSSLYGSSATPATAPVNNYLQPQAIYIRSFDGAYFYLLQTILKKHQIFVKYDWYDPNVRIKTSDITDLRKFSPAEIRYKTFGTGYIFYIYENLKLVLYYDHPINESTGLQGYSSDLRDDTYTFRMQFRF